MSAVTPVARPAIQLPPAPGFAWERLKAQWISGDPFPADEQARDYYAVKAAIAAWLQPQSVLEIGVRAGYSALAFYMGAEYSEYVGLDSNRGDWGGVKGYIDHARVTVPNAHIYVFDTQQLTNIRGLMPNGPVLAHVDGDHGYLGAKHDIELVLDGGADVVVVDDYFYVPGVRAAADDVVQERNLTCAYVPDAMRGNLVIAGRSQLPPIPEPQ